MSRNVSPEATRDLLRSAGFRPTRQRLALAGLLFPKPGHKQRLTATALYAMAKKAKIGVSLATVYNTLNQFTQAGLLREVMVSPGPSFFDTNTAPHHHVLNEDTGALTDLAPGRVKIKGIPRPPKGSEIAQVDVVVRQGRAHLGHLSLVQHHDLFGHRHRLHLIVGDVDRGRLQPAVPHTA